MALTTAPNPAIAIIGPKGNRISLTGRRVGVLLSGVTIKSKQVVWQSHKCPSHLCVNPEHSEVGTRSGALLAFERRDGWSKRGSRAKAALNLVARSKKVTADQVAEIRASDEPHKVISEKYGICLSQIYKIRTRRC